MTPLDSQRLRADFPGLRQQMNGKPLVYLDSAATSPKPQVMIDRISELYAREYARAEEGYALSREATATFEGVRQKVARLINAAEAREVVFCRGATEALNMAACCFERGGLHAGDEVVVTQAEHHSNIVPWLLACRQTGARLRAVPVSSRGDIDLEAFEKALTERVRVAAVIHVSNVTGGVQPVKQMTEMAHARGIPVLVDGAQAVPHLPVDVRDIGCDFYAGSGHKMGGPSSVGFLYGRAEVLERMPVAEGGSLMAKHVTFEEVIPKPIPHKYEAGEPAFGEVSAWEPALDYWTEIGLGAIAAYERDLAAYVVQRLEELPGVRVLGRPAERLSIVTFTVDGIPPAEVAAGLDREGIAVRAGNLAAEPLLAALGTREAVRASFAFYNTTAEADALVRVLAGLVAGKK